MLGLMKNDNNPHILGLVAQEIFFAEDRIILVEGQEDVIFFKRVQEEVGQLGGTFFGWGVGGAENMEHIATVLKEIGFAKVVGIVDGNRSDLAKTLSSKFPMFHFFSIPAEDVRTKKARPEKPRVLGLLNDRNDAVRAEYLTKITQLFETANSYLRG